MTADVEALRLAANAVDRAHTAAVREAFDLRDARSAADTAVRKLAGVTGVGAIRTLATSLLLACEAELERNRAEQDQLAAAAGTAYEAFRAAEQAADPLAP